MKGGEKQKIGHIEEHSCLKVPQPHKCVIEIGTRQKLSKSYYFEIDFSVQGITKVRFWAQNAAEGGEKQKICHIEENRYLKVPQPH